VLKPVTEAEFLRRLDNYTTRVADTLNGFGAENTEKRDQARRRVIEAFMSLHARLEMNDEFPAHDGIACRDATIKLQDERIAKLQSQSAMATGGQVKTAAPVCGTCHGRGYIGDDEANARNMESNPTCDVYLVKPCPDCKPAAQSEREAFERECADVDALLTHLGLDPERCRTDGGALNLPRIKTFLSEKK